MIEEGLALYRDLGHKAGVSTFLRTLALAFIAMGKQDFPSAKARTLQSHALYTEVGNKWGIAGSLVFLGYLAARESDFEKAVAFAKKSIMLYREIKETVGTLYCFLVLAFVAREQGDLGRAIRLIAAADDLRVRPNPPIWNLRPFSFDFPGETAAIREKVGVETFDREWKQGRAMSLPEASAYARGESGEGHTD